MNDLLEQIRTFPPHGNAREWLELCVQIWNRTHGHTIRPTEGRLGLITGGWPSNEEIILAMQANTRLWNLTWESSFRGGRHYFEIPH